MNINAFLMSELSKLKDDQKRLNDELLSLKIQNMKLTAKLENAICPPVTYLVLNSNI
jgi:hypothetical protein